MVQYDLAKAVSKVCYTPGMELWFLIAVLGAVSAGVSNFFFKVAAVNNCNAELFVLYGSLTSATIAGLFVLFGDEPVLAMEWLG